MALSDPEARHLAISLLTAPTARDKQRKIGASNLCNGCQHCLASNMMGDMRDTPMLDRAWGGRTVGTAIHGTMEERMTAAQDAAQAERTFHDALQYQGSEFQAQVSEQLLTIGRSNPGALVEYNMSLGTMGTYGEIRSTTDLVLPAQRHGFDWKGTTKKKSALMRDFLGQTNFGRKHKDVKLSENEYAKEMVKSEYRVNGYYGQLQLYGKGLNDNGIKVDRLSIVFISRDDTMWWDNPTSDGYEDASKMRGVWVLSFDYNEAYATELWDRGLEIWERLEAGEVPADFPSDPNCFPCGIEARDSAKTVTPILKPGPAIQATLAA
jgi:hypothetical protein